MRPLNQGQMSALRLVARGFITHNTSKSFPSLRARGLVTARRSWDREECGGYGGRVIWEMTDAGHAEVRRIEAAMVARVDTTGAEEGAAMPDKDPT